MYCRYIEIIVSFINSFIYLALMHFLLTIHMALLSQSLAAVQAELHDTVVTVPLNEIIKSCFKLLVIVKI